MSWTPEELASLFETRQPVVEAQYRLARRAWLAFREPTPAALDDLRHTDTAAMPYLAEAITRFLQEYPWTSDGLSRTERRLLQLADVQEIAFSAAFPRMHDGEGAYYVTDLSLTALAETLSRSSPPLLTLKSEPMSGGENLKGRYASPKPGVAILAGKLDRVTTCGIDRWLGGVHLHQGAAAWRWDDGSQRIISR